MIEIRPGGPDDLLIEDALEVIGCQNGVDDDAVRQLAGQQFGESVSQPIVADAEDVPPDTAPDEDAILAESPDSEEADGLPVDQEPTEVLNSKPFKAGPPESSPAQAGDAPQAPATYETPTEQAPTDVEELKTPVAAKPKAEEGDDDAAAAAEVDDENDAAEPADDADDNSEDDETADDSGTQDEGREERVSAAAEELDASSERVESLSDKVAELRGATTQDVEAIAAAEAELQTAQSELDTAFKLMDIAEAHPRPPKPVPEEAGQESGEAEIRSLHLPHGAYMMYHAETVGNETATRIDFVYTPEDLTGHGIATRFVDEARKISESEGIVRIDARAINSTFVHIMEGVFGGENLEMNVTTQSGERVMDPDQVISYLEGATEFDIRAVNITARIPQH